MEADWREAAISQGSQQPSEAGPDSPLEHPEGVYTLISDFSSPEL